MRPGVLLCLLLVLAGISTAQDTNFPKGPQYLMNYGSPLFFHPIATPSLSLGEEPPTSAATEAEEGEGVRLSISPVVESPVNLYPIYYGQAAVAAAANQTPAESSGVIEISSAQPAHALPSSIIDIGVTRLTNAQSLRERGYGWSLGEVSAYWKEHKRHATRTFTNRDVERLHGS